MITVIDYGAGNLHSLEGALDRLGLAHRRTERPGDLGEGPLILPGVGHFAAARAALVERGWWKALPLQVAQGRSLLGICLGLQLLTEGSEEAPGVPGLGLLPGQVRRLGGEGIKVPHMGWSALRGERPHSGLPDPAGHWLYFVHSYALDVGPHTVYAAQHGRLFSALDVRELEGGGRVLGIQPHPEKSGVFGLELLASLLALA